MYLKFIYLIFCSSIVVMFKEKLREYGSNPFPARILEKFTRLLVKGKTSYFSSGVQGFREMVTIVTKMKEKIHGSRIFQETNRAHRLINSRITRAFL